MSPETNFGEECSLQRRVIKEIAKNVNFLKNTIKNRPEVVGQDTGEMIANVTLAYRHLEDASMRIGKAIQAFDGGVSVYDKDQTVGTN